MTHLFTSFNLPAIVAEEDARREQEKKEREARERAARIAELRRQHVLRTASAPADAKGQSATPVYTPVFRKDSSLWPFLEKNILDDHRSFILEKNTHDPLISEKFFKEKKSREYDLMYKLLEMPLDDHVRC